MIDTTPTPGTFNFFDAHVYLTGDPERRVGYRDETREKISRAKWKPLSKFRKLGPNGQPARRLLHINGRNYKVSRVVWSLHHRKDIPEDMEVDHIDRDPLNNDPSNLRLVNRSRNTRNQSKCRTYGGVTPSSQFRGVSWDSQRGKWKTEIQIGGTLKFIGRFTHERGAAKAYQAVVACLRPLEDPMSHFGIDAPLDITQLLLGTDPECPGFDIDRVLARITAETDQLAV